MKVKQLFVLVLSLVACFFFVVPARAGDVEVELNSSNGSTAFEVMDSTSAVQAQIDSDGNMVIRGGLRLDSGGAEHTTPEQLIVDDRIGIGTTSPDANLDVEDTSGSEFIRLTTAVDNIGMYGGAGSPEGAVTAQLGSIYFDYTNGAAYLKDTGDNTNTGWQVISTGAATNYWSRTGTALSPATANDTLRLDAGTYFNFGATAGAGGYGVRDNAGTIEFKNSGGSWASISAGANQLTDLTDVNSSTATNGNIFMADGTDWESVAQTLITSLGTIGTGTWQATPVADAYVANDLTISAGTIDNSAIGATTPAAGAFTTLSSSGNITSGGNVDIDANSLILDADGDSSVSAAVDDTILIRLGGADEFTMGGGAITPIVDNALDFGTTANRWQDLYLAGNLHDGTNSTTIANIVTLAGTQTLTNKTLTSPTIGTSPTAVGATWTDLGTVTTADINGGTIDSMTIGGAAPAAGTFTTMRANTSAIIEDPGVGTNTVTVQSPTGLAASYSLTLPVDDGTSGQVLSTDGSGTLSWATLSGSAVIDSGTSGALAAGTVTVNFAQTYASAPIVVITPTISQTPGNNDIWPHVSATTTTSFTITADTNFNGATFNWIAIGT
ncbi:MAG: hypothetical protein JSW17_02250 [Candidatus Omnitrophota bacterium]|nr:MAG: hypothetical protein JSW17_02250 [Candidatus Omnitrophota bacterium]